MKRIDDELRDVVRSIREYIETEEISSGMALSHWKGTAPGLPVEKEPDSGKRLIELQKEVRSCKKCDLWRTRRQTVFGAGNPKAALLFVGEGPGMEEDLQGIPFVGKAGKLLTKIIEAMKLTRDEIYIANVVKCRPPNNRNPLPAEIISCQGYLAMQIELIKPKVICALGKFAAQTLLASTEPISRLRGKFYEYKGTKLMPTFHPAYLLRNPGDKKLVWEDMKMIKKELSGHGA